MRVEKMMLDDNGITYVIGETKFRYRVDQRPSIKVGQEVELVELIRKTKPYLVMSAETEKTNGGLEMNRLRQFRKQKGLTLEELAKELQEKENLKIVPNGLGKYEREEREPKKETWVKLADYYNVPVSYLMGLPDGLVQHINKTQTMTIDDVKSNRLRELRKKLGFTRKQVSEDMKECGIDIPPSTLSSYEKGERNPKIDKLEDLAFYYRVPLSYLKGDPMNFEELQELVIDWAYERNIIDVKKTPKQFMKVTEELGELAEGINKDNQGQIKDSLGDILVTLIILSKDLDVDLLDCLRGAYDVIKDRTGKTVDGVFVKEEDLHE